MAFSQPLGVGSFFYLWPLVFAAYFCAKRFVVLAYGWMTITLGVGLALNETHVNKLDTFVGTFSTVGLMTGLVASMTAREARLRHRLAVAAETDPLTGLLNRRAFNPRLAELVDRAVAERRPLSVVMFDLDHFKRLNDEHGHSVGDVALQQVGAVLEAMSRDGDLVSRFGGEEFAVALPGADPDRAEAYTERVAAEIRRQAGIPGWLLTTSAGVCTLTATTADAETLVQRADTALYAAKAAGRDRPARWTEDGPDVGIAFGARPEGVLPAGA
jgi:diguanylate cyclase (GGDEF)-like protein